MAHKFNISNRHKLDNEKRKNFSLHIKLLKTYDYSMEI